MDSKIIPYSNLINFAGLVLVIGVTFVLMIFGKPIILPIVIALVITFLIIAISEQFQRISIFGYKFPGWLAQTISILLIVWGFRTLFRRSSETVRQLIQEREMVTNNINHLLNSAPAPLLSFLPREALVNGTTYDAGVLFSMGLDLLTDFSRVFLGQAASVAGQSLVILVYVIFMLVEQRTFVEKIGQMYSDPQSNETVQRVLKSIGEMVKTYFTVKTLVSLFVGGASYIVMLAFSLDNAFLWAIIIFVLNFIPYLGSVTAVVFPVVFSLVQFGDWTIFLALTIILYAIQIISGSFIEPTLAGRSLNISPLVVFASLTTFGTIWGVPGMILSVPIVIIMTISFSHFETTRPIAILLSGRGRLATVEPEVMVRRKNPPAAIRMEEKHSTSSAD
ncbi:MAG: AI-2E family transporter [Chloroflexota bacterium]